MIGLISAIILFLFLCSFNNELYKIRKLLTSIDEKLSDKKENKKKDSA